MSLDVFVQDLPRDVTRVEELPDDFRPGDLDLSRDEVLAAARAVGGEVDDVGATWARWTGPGYDIEIGLEHPERSFALHCSGDAPACRAAAVALVERLGVRAFVTWDDTIIG